MALQWLTEFRKLPDADVEPGELLAPDKADIPDITPEVDDYVKYTLEGAYRPFFGTVVATNGAQMLVRSEQGGVRWIWEDAVVLVLKAAAVEAEAPTA